MATHKALADISVTGEPVGEGEEFEADEQAVRARRVIPENRQAMAGPYPGRLRQTRSSVPVFVDSRPHGARRGTLTRTRRRTPRAR